MTAVVRPKTVTATSDVPTALIIGIPVEPTSPGTTSTPPPMPKKPENNPVTKSEGGDARRALHGAFDGGVARGAAAAQHHHAGHDHRQSEEKQQSLPIEVLADRRADDGAATFPPRRKCRRSAISPSRSAHGSTG